MKLAIGIKGRAKASVVRDGREILEGQWQRNLLLDQGMNRLAEVVLCNLFAYCAKGTGTTATLEDVANTNDYTQAASSTTVTRVAGTRDFTGADVGKLIRYDGTGAEVTIISFTDATHVEVDPAVTVTETAQDIKLYHVQQTGLDAEVTRTNEYSAVDGENDTTTVGNVRTLLRTFLFESEDTIDEVVPATNQYSQAANTVTRTAGARDFAAGDVGKTITFLTGGQTGLITAFTDPTHVDVDSSQVVAAQAIKLTDPTDKVEVPAGSNTYDRGGGGVVTRTAGTRDFIAGDVGKIIHFITSGVQATIVTFTDATHVTVDVVGVLAAQNIGLYGFTDYNEVGFSDSPEQTTNLNIRVKLASAVRVYVSTPLTSSEQLKVAYELELKVEPDTEQTGSLSSIIVDPGNEMSGNKNGKFGIESYATSVVTVSGETDDSFADLEPSIPGSLALSLNNEAIDPLGGTIRNNGVVHVDLEADTYVAQSFRRVYRATFGLNEAISNSWRTLMLYDPDSESSIFAFVFNNPQRKTGERSLRIAIFKEWARDLS